MRDGGLRENGERRSGTPHAEISSTHHRLGNVGGAGRPAASRSFRRTLRAVSASGMILRTFLLFLVVCFSALSPASADPAPFDLEGPALQVIVTRAGKSLPIGAVPNLAAGDALAIKADLPADQSAHYVLIAGFLRGATNPPPKQWFYSVKDWTPAGRDGLKVTVPSGAQQVIVLLAPE
ncbi:MAG: hypothetical protein ACRYG4_21780, partial [Janthinobacterium lividum]